ncbi:ADP-ribosylglycohydrolase family protein [Candidatus Neomarinimicrobiota bacterium]
MEEISIEVLRDKIAGGWAGKMIGVSYGAKSEFRAKGTTFEKELPWEPSMVANSLKQDDLYVQMSFMMTMDQYGIDAPAERFAEAFANAGYRLWCANAQARKNYWDGIMPPESGSPEYNLWADAIDFQIEADYIGLMCPGMPRTANRIADKVGHIMNFGDGVYGGMFVAALYVHAFIEDDIHAIVKHALRSIPAESNYAKAVQDVVDLHAKYPSYWRSAWAELESKWGSGDLTGPLDPFNIDAKLNGAYIVMGLLYGEGDMGKTMEVSVRCGQDSDCNPSNAAAIIGVIKGYSNLDIIWTSGIEPLADSTFIYTDYSFNSVVDNTLKYAKRLIEENSGVVSTENVTIPVEIPTAPPLEVSFPTSVPIYKSSVFDDYGWEWQGRWEEILGNPWGAESIEPRAKYAEEPGAEMKFTFNGTGIALLGKWAQDGGKADVYVDGKLHRTIDTYYWWAGEGKDHMFIWHALNLEPGEHTIRLVVRGDKKPAATGTRIYLNNATVYTSIDKSDR